MKSLHDYKADIEEAAKKYLKVEKNDIEGIVSADGQIEKLIFFTLGAIYATGNDKKKNNVKKFIKDNSFALESIGFDSLNGMNGNIFDKHGDDEVLLEIDSKSGKSKLKKIIKCFKKLCE